MPDSPSDKLTEDLHPVDGNENSLIRRPIQRSESVPEDLAGKRFDQIAAQLFPEFSRGRLQHWIESGDLKVDGNTGKSRQKLATGSILELDAEFEVETAWRAESLPLSIIFEDEDILVLDKPRNCVVHPAPGLTGGTLANAVLAHCPGNAELPRCGIIHRLDKDTTGLLVVAKSLAAHASLVRQLQARTVKRLYRAVVCGQLISGGTIDLPIGRHPTQRTRMAVFQNKRRNSQLRTADPEANDSSSPDYKSGFKQAVTRYRIHQRFAHHTELAVQLETGRTHQIRVHMAHIRHPLVGDTTYNPRYKRPAGISETLDQQLRRFSRQALHATELSFLHPVAGDERHYKAAIPEDYTQLLSALANEDS